MVDMEVLSAKAAEMDLSLASLERKADLGNGVIRNWDKRSPTLSTLEKVAKVLGCQISDLVKEES